jgi:chromosome segregation ATPase
MVRRVKSSDEEPADLDNTAELPALDVTAYEKLTSPGNSATSLAEPDASPSASDEDGPKALPLVSPAETVRDIEAWIATQDERARLHRLVVEDLQEARADAHARAENLALELDIAQKALQTALSRANDGERAALDNDAAARAAEIRAADLRTELEAVRQELARVADRAGSATAELTAAHAMLTVKAHEQEEMRQRQAELARALDERSNRVTESESELAALRSHIAEANRELAQRAERIAAIESTSDLRQSALNKITREHDALATRLASFRETLQSNEWQRNVWNEVRHELEAELEQARTRLCCMEAECAEFVTCVSKMTAELAERAVAIGHLEAAGAAQAVALEELSAARQQEQESYTASAKELRLRNETLVSEIRALEERQQRSVASLTERETELAASRAARMAVEESFGKLHASNTAHGMRIVELEKLVANLSSTIQLESEAAQRAKEVLLVRERELAEERSRASKIDAELHAALGKVTEQTAAARATESALNLHAMELAIARDRLADFEREATCHSQRLAQLQAELGRVTAQVVQTETTRSAAESELDRARKALQHETERACALEAAHESLASEVARARGALDERDLQLRRLERYATTNAEALSRIRVGMQRADVHRYKDVRSPEYTATLLPLDDSDAPELRLGRQTTIGRAAESDLRLNDSSVSRRHAVVTVGPNGAFIEDLRSANGVRLNRQRVRHARLVDGDVIELGLKPFRFTLARSASDGAT